MEVKSVRESGEEKHQKKKRRRSSIRKQEEFARSFADIDKDHSGALDFEEFAAIMRDGEDKQALRALFDLPALARIHI